MRIIVIGEKLDEHLFEIRKATAGHGCNILFFKKNIGIDIKCGDIIIIESSMIGILHENIKNTVISVTFNHGYKKSLENEIVINPSYIKSIEKIIYESNNLDNTPIVVDHASVEVFRIAEQIAKTDTTVLITGETGTGKEILAQYIHRSSDRANNKFIAINCAAIPEALLESELFGHEKGAFTNAIQRRIGKFEEAHSGTLLLDEISEMPLSLQAKLLRIIQEKEFSRIGSNDSIKTDIRLIATSNMNLFQAVLNGTFREDLFYRLSVIPIEIPRLSSRPLDIIPLATFFCKKYSNSQKILSKKLLNALQKYPWKGNVRELENFVHRSVLLSSKNLIDLNDVTFNVYGIDTNDNFEQQKTLAQIEKEVILNALKNSNGNKTLASKKLSIPLRTLRHKLKTYE